MFHALLCQVAAGKRFGIPIKGTHAHSFVASFHSEDDLQVCCSAPASVVSTLCVPTTRDNGLRDCSGVRIH